MPDLVEQPRRGGNQRRHLLLAALGAGQMRSSLQQGRLPGAAGPPAGHGTLGVGQMAMRRRDVAHVGARDRGRDTEH